MDCARSSKSKMHAEMKFVLASDLPPFIELTCSILGIIIERMELKRSFRREEACALGIVCV